MFLQILMLTRQNKCHAAYFCNTRVSPNGFPCSEVLIQGCLVCLQDEQGWGGRRLLQTVTCQRGRLSLESLGHVAPVGNHRRLGQALALLLAGPWGSHCTFLGPSFSLRSRCGVTWRGESFTDGEALRRGYRSEDPDSGDLEMFSGWLPCDVQSRICFKISKGQLAQSKKILLISTAPRIERDGILPVNECESVAPRRVCCWPLRWGRDGNGPTSPERPWCPQNLVGPSAIGKCRLWGLRCV